MAAVSVEFYAVARLNVYLTSESMMVKLARCCVLYRCDASMTANLRLFRNLNLLVARMMIRARNR